MSYLLATLVVLIQVFTGAILILLIPTSRVRSIFEILGLGLALGTFLSMLSAVLLVNSPLKSFSWALPTLVVVIISVFRSGALTTQFKSLTLPRSESFAVLLGLFVGLGLIAINWIRVPLSSIRSGGSVDMYFFEALSRGVSEFGPAQSILMTDGQLRYHWFSYAWAGNLTSTSQLESFVALNRILPIVTLVGVVFLAAAWAASMRVGKGVNPSWVPSLAVLLLVFAGYTGALYGIVLNFDSPSQAFTTVWLLALVISFLHGLHSRSRALLSSSAVLVAVLTFATTGGKASHAIVALGGFFLVSLVGGILRLAWWRKALLLFLSSFLGFLIAYFWVLAGVGVGENLADAIFVRASTWQRLDPVAGRWGPLLGTLALILAIIPRLAGVGWFARNRANRLSPEFLFSSGAIGVSAAALLALRGGINELWFFLAASAPVAVISAYGVGQAQGWIKGFTGKGLVFSLIAATLASLASLVLSLNWKFTEAPLDFFLWPGILYWFSVAGVWVIVFVLAWFFLRSVSFVNGRQRLGAVLAISISALVLTSILTRPAVLWTQSRELVTEVGIVQPGQGDSNATESPGSSTEPPSLLDQQRAAAQWLTTNSRREQVVATSTPWSSFIPAFTGNQMYLAGERYQRGLGSTGETAEIDRRSALSLSLAAPTLGQLDLVALQLCEEGVAYLWVEGEKLPAELTAGKSQQFGEVSILNIEDRC